MENAKIALNMSMVKFIMWEKGPDYTFERVKKAGVSYFELSQVDMTDDFIKAAIEASEKHGVKIIASSVNFEPLFGGKGKGLDLVADLDRLIEVNHKLGVEYVRDSLMPRSCVHNEEGFHKAAEALNHYGKILKDAGIVKARKEGTCIYYYLDPDADKLNGLISLFVSIRAFMANVPDRSGDE